MIFLSITLTLAAGALYVIGFAPFNLWVAPIISLSVLAFCLNERNKWEAALIGLFFGLGMMGTGVSWIYNSISNYSSATNEQAIMVTFSFCFAMALFYAAHGFLYCWLNFSRKNIFTLYYSPHIMRVFSFAMIWVLLELIRSHLYIGFPWLLLGNTMIDTYLAPWAPIGGNFLVSLFASMTAICLVYIIILFPSIYVRRVQYKLMILVLIAASPWAVGSRMLNYNWTQPQTASEQKLTTLVIQGNIPQAHKWDSAHANEIINIYKSATYSNLRSRLVVWPEAATPYVHPQGQQVHNDISDRVHFNNANLIYGGLREDRLNNVYNSIFVAGEEDGIRKVYDKKILVPFGEFIPMTNLAAYFPGLFSQIDMSTFITSAGETPTTFIINDSELGNITIAPSICYEIAYGSYIATVATDSNLLISISNDAWFSDSLGPHQHMHAARMRALENQRYLIRASNNGISALVNERGKITAKINQFKFDTLYGEVETRSGNTPYQMVQDFPIWMLCSLGLLLCLLKRKSSLSKV